jgi:hypothetical protein
MATPTTTSDSPASSATSPSNTVGGTPVISTTNPSKDIRPTDNSASQKTRRGSKKNSTEDAARSAQQWKERYAAFTPYLGELSSGMTRDELWKVCKQLGVNKKMSCKECFAGITKFLDRSSVDEVR